MSKGFDSSGFGEILSTIFGLLIGNPIIGIVSVALSIVVTFVLILIFSRKSIFAKLILSVVLSLCVFIIGSFWILRIFELSINNYHTAEIEVELDKILRSHYEKNKPDTIIEARGSTTTGAKGKAFKFKDFTTDETVWEDQYVIIGEPEKLHIRVDSRKPIVCKKTSALKDEFEESSHGEDNTEVDAPGTAFDIDLSKARIMDSVFGNPKTIRLTFRYEDNFEYNEGDLVEAGRLFITNYEGLIRSKIDVKTTHDDGSLPCVKDLDIEYHEISGDESEYASNIRETFGLINFNLISPSEAKEGFTDTVEFLNNHSGNNQNENKKIISAFLKQNEDNLNEIVVSFLRSDKIDANQRRIVLNSILDVPIEKRPKSREFLGEVIPLVAFDDFETRRTAARILRAPGYADDIVTSAFVNYFEENKDSLGSIEIEERDYSALYLAAVAGRDIFYNKGISEVEILRSEFALLEKGERENRLRNALNTFDSGMQFVDYAPEERRVLFSKLEYGKALALLNSAVANYSINELSDSNQRQLEDAIYRKVKNGEKIAATQETVNEALQAFKKFLNSVSGNHEEYSWQHHIKQATSCTESADGIYSDCMTLSKSGN